VGEQQRAGEDERFSHGRKLAVVLSPGKARFASVRRAGCGVGKVLRVELQSRRILKGFYGSLLVQGDSAHHGQTTWGMRAEMISASVPFKKFPVMPARQVAPSAPHGAIRVIRFDP